MNRLIPLLTFAVLIVESVSASDLLTVAYQPVEQLRVLDGRVEAVNQATVSSQTNGRVAELFVDVNDYVEAGSIIIAFTDTEQQAALNQAKSSLNETQARLREAEAEYRRIGELVTAGLGSARDFDRALATRDAVAAQVESAQAAVASAQQQLDYTKVRAPYAGIVTARHVELGESVQSGQALMTGLSLESLRVVVDVPQSVAADVRTGKQARVLAGMQTIPAERVVVFPKAASETPSFRTRVDLPAGQYSLYPGMLVKVEFPVGWRQAMYLPSSAVVRRNELHAVYVASEHGPRLRRVRLGEHREDNVEVLAGLSDGEQVWPDATKAGALAAESGLEVQ
ncbi:MAG: hemolysin D [Lysobacteraceae bacterium]|nr:MAG: hemolysin D [Xanthomonadaceae bacterium]